MMLLTVKQIATFLNVDPVTIYRYMHLYRLPSYRIGGRRLFKQEEVDAWISAQKSVAA